MKEYTSHILDVFKKYNAQATFFVSGHNIGKGQIDVTDEYINVIKRMDAEGHQIGSHTWTHLDLSKITREERRLQMTNNEMAIRNIVGKIPTYMRPPYSSCSDECKQDMADLGYHLSYFDVNGEDYAQAPLGTFQNSLDWFKGNVTKNNATPEKNQWLSISHDIVNETAYQLTEYMLSTLTQLGYKAVTMGECMNDPPENWYRSSDNSSSTSVKVSGTPTASATSRASLTAPTQSATGSDSTTGTQDGTSSASASSSASATAEVTQSAASGLASSSLAALALSAALAFAFAL